MTDRNTTITVADHDTLPSVLDRISANGGTIRLVIPLGSSLFFTANEFQALRSVADQRGRELTVVSDDPLRQHLALMFDLPYVSESDEPAEESPSEPEIGESDGAIPESGAEVEQEMQPNPAAVTATAAAASTAETEAQPDSNPNLDEPVTNAEPIDTSPATQPKRDRKRIYGIVAAAVLVLIIAGVVAAFFLVPRATVAVHLREQPLSTSIVYGVATSGASPQEGSEVTITCETVEADITVESSTATTGEKSVPDKTASGTIVLSNPTTKDVTLGKGTSLTGDEGAVFILDENITIPKPAAVLGAPGLAEARVVSEQPGTAGNLGLGELSGRHESGVYFSNRNEAMTGGTDRMVQIVSEADLEKLRQDTEAKMREAAPDELVSALPDRFDIVETSIAAGATNFDFDHEVGDEAESVNVTARTHVTALSYDSDELMRSLILTLTPKFGAVTPTDYVLSPSTIQVGESVLVQPLPHGAQYRATATANAVANLSETAQNELAGQLARKSDSSASEILSGVPAIESFSVSYSPAVLPDRMPGNADRIEFEIDNAP